MRPPEKVTVQVESRPAPRVSIGILEPVGGRLGELAVIWASDRPLGDEGRKWRVWGGLWSASREQMGPIVNLNETTASSMERFPSAAMNNRGELIVTWQRSVYPDEWPSLRARE